MEHGSTRMSIHCMKIASALAAILCCILCVACSNSSGGASTASGQSNASEQSTGTTATAAAGMGSSSTEIDSDYVGEWTGYDVYTMEDVSETYVLHENGDWATLVVNADGSASLEASITGEYFSAPHLHLEYGTVEYLVYDEDGSLFGSLGYTRSGTTDWLVLSIPDDEVGMVCYTFFINN